MLEMMMVPTPLHAAPVLRASRIFLSAEEDLQPVFVFPITGGPCAGKTTAIAHLLERHTSFFPEYDITVVPEAATLYHQYGGRLPFGQPASSCGRVTEGGRNLLWELLLNELKRTLEARTVNAALIGPRPSIVLCDRGIFDSRAYLPTGRDWRAMLDLASWDEGELTGRYDHVFHMKMCPRDAYTSANNAARRETYEEALALDGATWAAWDDTHGEDSHSLVGGVDGDESMEGKLAALTLSMQRRVGNDDGAGGDAARAWIDELQIQLADGDGEEEGARADEQLVASAATRKRRGWYLPPDAVIALADTVASAPDLGDIAPTAISIVRRVARVDAMLPVKQEAAAADAREAAIRWASDIGQSSGLYRDTSGLADPESPLAF